MTQSRDYLGLQAHDIVNCYAKYVPVHSTQVSGTLTITPTRIIFEPNLDDSEVKKNGSVVSFQYSVETDRLLKIGILTNEIYYRL